MVTERPRASSAFTLESAREAARTGEIALWVGEFLASLGSDNAVLAAKLAQQPHQWVGPVRLPVDQLERLAGPDGDAPILRVDPSEWEHDIAAMEASIEKGWEAPPLLVELRDGQLLLQDGNHRYEALVREGETSAWAIVWCDDPVEFDRLASLER